MGKRACGFVIFRRLSENVEYLLMQANYGSHHWSPPKGHVDKEETDMQTALRETEEEAGFTKQDLKIYEDAKRELHYPVKNKPKTAIYWLAELINKSKEVRMSDEHKDFKWLTLREACETVGYESLQETLKYFDKYIADKLTNN